MNSSPPLIGATLGPYLVQSLLGQGGMATVYQGYDQSLKRPIAIKVLSVDLAGDPSFVDRFRREAQLIANLRHPHVVQVYTFGEHDGLPYMVQELLSGQTLEQRIRDLAVQGSVMPRDEAVATITQLASALDAAHAVGVIHRDVKPSNAIYNAQRQLVLTDFGIARSDADASRTATAAGMVMGTVGYIAPEQAISSASLTSACDIYALGVVIFELLTGRLPFDADTAVSVVLKHLYDPPPRPTSVRSDLPPAVDAVVLRALEKEPTARFPTAGACAEALAQAWPGQGAVVVPPVGNIHLKATSPWVPPTAHLSNIHKQTTAVWTPPNSQPQQAPASYAAAAQAPAPALPPAAVPVVPQPGMPAMPQAAADVSLPTSHTGRRMVLPLLASLLLLLLACAVVLVWNNIGTTSGEVITRGAASPAPTDALPAAAIEPSVAIPDATSVLVALPSPATGVPPGGPEATVAPPAAATTAPTSLPSEPAVVPTAPPPTEVVVPATPPEPLDLLANLITAAIADGRAGRDGKDLSKIFNEVRKALAEDNTKKAKDKLRDLSRKLAEGERENKMDSTFVADAQAAIAAVAEQYGLNLSKEGGNDDKGDD